MYHIIIKRRRFIHQKYHYCLVRNGRNLMTSEKQHNLKDVEEVAGHLADKLGIKLEYNFERK